MKRARPLYSMISKTGRLESSSVGPKHDPYHRESVAVTLKDGRTFRYVYCSLAGEFIQGEPVEALPSHSDVFRWMKRKEEKEWRKHFRETRRPGTSRRKAFMEWTRAFERERTGWDE